MKLAVLTTATSHHLYYVWRLAEQRPLASIVLERRTLRAPFETKHPFEDLRDQHEREVLLAGGPERFADVAPTEEFDTVNDEPALATLAKLAPDVVVVFGTGLLRPPVIGLPKLACLNLHGGDPEQYRGLDSHLWAIYHGDFAGLVTTLHTVEPEFDTGDIVGSKCLPLSRGMGLHQLRGVNTKACVDLTLETAERLEREGTAGGRKQASRGRYYSFMPAVLKETCLARFDRHVSKL